MSAVDDSFDKTVKRRERNKIAAAKCRQRRIDRINYLTEKAEELEEISSKLESELTQLQNKQNAYIDLLNNHNCILPNPLKSHDRQQNQTPGLQTDYNRLENSTTISSRYNLRHSTPKKQTSSKHTKSNKRKTTLTTVKNLQETNSSTLGSYPTPPILKSDFVEASHAVLMDSNKISAQFDNVYLTSCNNFSSPLNTNYNHNSSLIHNPANYNDLNLIINNNNSYNNFVSTQMQFKLPPSLPHLPNNDLNSQPTSQFYIIRQDTSDISKYYTNPTSFYTANFTKPCLPPTNFQTTSNNNMNNTNEYR